MKSQTQGELIHQSPSQPSSILTLATHYIGNRLPGAFFWSINPPRSNSISSSYTLLCQASPFTISSQKPLLNQKDLSGFLQGHPNQRSVSRIMSLARGLIILVAPLGYTRVMLKQSEIDIVAWVKQVGSRGGRGLQQALRS